MLYYKLLLIVIFSFWSCSDNDSTATTDNEPMVTNQNQQPAMNQEDLARVISVTTSGEQNNYQFSVGISSPDTGCDQYADWWEVITPEGQLVYRRVLLHSHVDEQPFVRSGGAVMIGVNDSVMIRVHMNNTGYSNLAYQGSVANGFEAIELADGFAEALANQEPLPDGCAF